MTGELFDWEQPEELNGRPARQRNRYEYAELTRREAELMIRMAIPARIDLGRPTLEEDYGGVDVVYRLNGSTGLQLRCRFDRPEYAAETDVTFRHTEPGMIARRTYAPLMLFLWFGRDGYAEAGRLVDIYPMNRALRPPLGRRHVNPNGDGTGWIGVGTRELIESRSLLRNGTRDGWADFKVGATGRIQALLNGERP